MKNSHPITAFWCRTTLIAALLLMLPALFGSSFVNLDAQALRLRAEPNLTAPALALITAAEDTSSLDVSFGDLYGEPTIELPSEPMLAYVNTGGNVLNIRSAPARPMPWSERPPAEASLPWSPMKTVGVRFSTKTNSPMSARTMSVS